MCIRDRRHDEAVVELAYTQHVKKAFGTENFRHAGTDWAMRAAEKALEEQKKQEGIQKQYAAGLKDSVGERPNHSTWRHQNSVKILPEFEINC